MTGGRNRTLGVLGLCAFAMLAASPSLPVQSLPLELAEGTPVSEGLVVNLDTGQSLSEMSTGIGQVNLVADGTAQSRNATIPIVPGQIRLMSAYAPIGQTSQGFSTALRCLTQAVYYEAANETLDGKRAVAQVVLNRMRHPAYPNSVCGVIYQGVNDPVCQFSFTCDGALLRAPVQAKWEQSRNVARAALAGAKLDAVGSATHYHADYVVPKWAYTMTKIEVIGTHIFYRFPGSPGEPSSFSARWAKAERIPSIDWSRFSAVDGDELVAEQPIEESWVKGLTVVPDKTDRHAENDVGGRLDTTKTWRLSIPDPVSSANSFSAAVDAQGVTTPTKDGVEQ